MPKQYDLVVIGAETAAMVASMRVQAAKPGGLPVRLFAAQIWIHQ